MEESGQLEPVHAVNIFIHEKEGGAGKENIDPNKPPTGAIILKWRAGVSEAQNGVWMEGLES